MKKNIIILFLLAALALSGCRGTTALQPECNNTKTPALTQYDYK